MVCVHIVKKRYFKTEQHFLKLCHGKSNHIIVTAGNFIYDDSTGSLDCIRTSLIKGLNTL